MSDIAIIGFSGRFPGAKSVEEFWNNLCEGKESVNFFTTEELVHHGIPKQVVEQPNYVKAAPTLENIDMFDADFFNYTPGHANVLDPQHRILLECSWEALEHAGYATNTKSQNVGCFVGSGGIVTSYISEYFLVNPLLRGMTGSFEHLANDKDFVPTRVSYNLNLTGPSMAIQTACSTSLLTVHQACQSLLQGECEMALAGGVNVRIPHLSGYIRQRGDIYSEDGHTKAFDANATGIVFGSGCGIVLLKPLEKAQSDGDKIYAVIKGSAINNDGGEKLSYTASSYEGQVECIKKALKKSNISAETLQYVEAHGTGTVMGDPVEVAALTKVFQEYPCKPQSCGLGSVKSNVGHLDTVAGIASLIKSIMILNHYKLPPQINITELNPKIDFASGPFYVNTQVKVLEKQSQPLRVGINSLGIGGTNAFLILEEAPKTQKKETEKRPLLLNLSARTKEGLKSLIKDFSNVIDNASEESAIDVCYTATTGRGQFECRLSILANSLDTLKRELKSTENHTTILPKGYAVNLAFLMDDPSEQSKLLLETLQQEVPAFTTCYKEILEASNDPAFALQAAHLKMWMIFGIMPKVIYASLAQLPIAAYILGYLNVQTALLLYKTPKGDCYLKALKEHLTLGSYNVELKLLASGIDLITLKEFHSFSDIENTPNSSFDEYCKDEEIHELFVLDDHASFSAIIPRLMALTSVTKTLKDHLLCQLQHFYKIGAMINWDRWYIGAGLSKVPLPTYPFQRKHHWIPTTKRLHLQDSLFCWNTLPIKAPSLQEDVYEIVLSLPEYPVLHDHYFCDRPMVAGSALMSWIIEVAAKYYAIDSARIEDFSFTQALMVPEEGSVDVQLVVTPSDNDRYKFTIRTLNSDFLMKNEMWVEHASGYFTSCEKATKPPAVDVKVFDSGALSLSGDEIYCKMAKRGLELTTAYRCLGSVKMSGKEALAKLDTQHLHTHAFYGRYHPGILDALFQLVQCLVPAEIPEDKVFLLSKWQAVTFFKECQSPRYIHAKIVESQGNQWFTANVQLLNEQMEVLASVDQVSIQRGSRDIAFALEMAHYQRWQYSLGWKLIDKEINQFTSLKGRVLMYGDDVGLAAAIKPLLEAQGIQLVAEEPVDAVLYLMGVNSDRGLTPEQIKEQVSRASSPLLDIAKRFYDTSVPIYIVTQGGVGTEREESHLNPLQGTLWGMGRTLSVERGKGPCYLIDLDPDKTLSEQAGKLCNLLFKHPKEEQIALRDHDILVPRLSHYQKTSPKKLGINYSAPYEITFRSPSWSVVEKILAQPKEGEVAVKISHSGISYRDYLETTGAFGGVDNHIGDDFAGIVEAIGPGVTNVKVGDACIGLHQGTLVSHVIVKSDKIAKISAGISSEQAACWPLAFITASYGLQHLAKLSEGQTIVIPSAASGVGYAAVQIAKVLKARIIATVRGSEKAFLLRQQGVQDVVDTAESNWNAQLEKLLAEQQIDAILAGTHQDITEECAKRLSPQGTIIDLSGGRLRYSDNVSKHAGFMPVHMYEVIKNQPGLVHEMLIKASELLQSGACAPMTTQGYSLAELPTALAHIANPNHLKKVILHHAEPDDALFKANSTYVVVGGLGALGRILIPWLIENGAKSVCVIDIAEQDPQLLELLQSQHGEDFLKKFEAKYGKDFLFHIKKKYGQNAQINYYKCDVNSSQNVREIFELIAKEMLPIKGILHCATMLFDAAIPKQTLENFHKILSVKTIGSSNLHFNSLHLDLDYFLMFSSIASLMGSPNQFNYSAANSFQDTLSHHRSRLGLHTLAINWSPWKVGVGAYMGQSAQKVWESWGSYMLDPAKDLNSLRYLMKCSTPQVALFAIDWKKFTSQFEQVPGYLIDLANAAKKVEGASQKENVFITQFAGLSESEAKAKMTDFLKEEISFCLQLDKEKIEPSQNFASLGIDSLMSISVRNHLQKKIGKEFPATIMFNYPTLDALCGFILSTFTELIKAEGTTEKKTEQKTVEMSDEEMKGFLEGIDIDE